MKINIAIVDDHPMIIGGLESLLSGYPQLRLVAAYRSGSDLIAQLASVQADILLLDIQLQDKNGDLLVPVILKQRPDIKILVLTNNSSQLYIHNMLRMGASGYVLKSSEPDVLIGAIGCVHQGKEFVDPSLKEQLARFRDRMRKEVAIKPTLTLREKTILQLTVEGHSMPEISRKLFIGLRTVEFYRSNLFLKLEVTNMASLIRKAIQLGLVEL